MHPHLLDVRVIGWDLGGERVQDGLIADILELQYQPVRIAPDEQREAKLSGGLQNQTGATILALDRAVEDHCLATGRPECQQPREHQRCADNAAPSQRANGELAKRARGRQR